MWGATVHGVWCSSRTWPTRCPSCGEPVFFFMCNCGSKVFFDELGPPWPLHDCDTSWTRKLRCTTDKTGRITVELGPGITISRPLRSFGIDQNIIAKAHAAKAKKSPDPVVVVKPNGQTPKEIVGILREVSRNSNPIKAYRLNDTSMARAMLGRIGAQRVGKITVHVPSTSEEQRQSFSAWIPSELLKEPRIVHGITVSLSLEGVRILSHGYTWFCD